MMEDKEMKPNGTTNITAHHIHQQRTEPPATFSVRRRVQLCLALLALECFISFEEIFMLPVLQRVNVPVALVSLPGTISSAIGVFVIPLLGWASDRLTCGTQYCGQKRPFAIWTISVCLTGISILVFVNSASLYGHSDNKPLVSNNNSDIGVSKFRTEEEFLMNTTDAANRGGSTVVDILGAVTSTHEAEHITKDQQRFTENTSSTLDPLVLPFTNPIDVPPLHPKMITSPPSAAVPQPAQALSAPAGNVSDSLSSSTSGHLSTMGILGILGFVISDHGYDSSMSTVKAYIIAVTPPSQHDDIFVLGTLAGAVGGCITSLLGFVDLSGVFPDETDAELDKGIAQCLAQGLILLTALLVLGSVSMMTGSENLAHFPKDAVSKSADAETAIDECGNCKKDSLTTSSSIFKSNMPETPSYSETTPLVIDSHAFVPDTCLGRLCSVWKRWRYRICLCVMTFLGLSANYAYFVYVTNYVAEVIFDGEPTAETGSEAYENYVVGVHVASLGMLTFYCLFVVFNIFHNKILSKIGMRREYLLASVGCAVLMLTLAFTDNIIVFFFNAVTMAVFRSAVYTVPYILSNNYAKEEAGKGGSNSAHSSGVAMASISAMIPASYFLVSLVMGPLIDVTGNPGTPILFAAASCILGIISTLFVKFD